MTDEHFDADVAIIGYGPSGVSAANFLGSRGIRAIAFERSKEIYPRARAVTINDWTMRCYQSVGLSEALQSVMDETYALRWVTYDGRELVRVGFPPGELGFSRSYSIYQPAMEEKLREGAARYSDFVQVRFGADVTDVSQDAGGVDITVRDAVSGSQSKVRARYALACDGGSSLIRERLGVRLVGDTADTRWVVIDAKVKRWWPDRHILTFWSDKKRPVVDIALAMGNHRWELPLEPHELESDFETHDQLWKLLGTMGITTDDVDIHQHAFYKHHMRFADRWREGRVILVGDAAHLMPPWAGQGMQSGVRDAHNISWKLAAVLAGRLPDAILDTYQLERAPDVERYSQLSLGMGRIVKQELSDAELAAAQQPPGDEPSPLLAAPVLHAGWITGDAGGDSPVGKYIPQPLVSTAQGRIALLDKVIGNDVVLLGDMIDPLTFLSEAQLTEWRRLGASFRTVRTPDSGSESPDDIIDIKGSLTAWMRRYGAKVIAVRPDRFVAASDVNGLSVPKLSTMAPKQHPAS